MGARFIFGLGLFLTGCEGWFFLSEPTYKQPDNAVALAAFKNALDADWVKQPYDLMALPKPGLMNYMLAKENDRKRMANRAGPRVLNALKALDVEECKWQRSILDKLPKYASKRLTELPSGVYRCSFTLHYEFKGLLGKKYEVPSEGEFFEENGAMSYLGKFAYPDSPKLKERRIVRKRGT